MEEASSIAKAIEQGWQRAGKPQEFSVKILEEPQKNFLGFTKKSAKIALFIPVAGKPLPESTYERPAAAYKNNQSVAKQPKHTPPTQARREQPKSALNTRTLVTSWNEELSSFAHNWLADCIGLLPIAQPAIKKDFVKDVLEFHLSSALSDSEEQQQILFKSLAHLAMEAVRNKFKQNFRSLRIFINVQ